MNCKEKEKLWLKHVKELCVIDSWKFKSCFIYKQIGDLYFCATFYVDRKDPLLSGSLKYKPLTIDNIFWDIVNLPGNKRRPLSFRAHAASCVDGISFMDFKKTIANELKPQKEIAELLKEINQKAVQKSKRIKTLSDFQTDMQKDEEYNVAGIITSLIEEKNYKSALLKIKECQTKAIRSRFGFGDQDFYDLAKEYCLKHSN